MAVEVFAWGERHPTAGLTRMMRRPGFEIQRVVGTREPTAEQLEVGHGGARRDPARGGRGGGGLAHGHRGPRPHAARPEVFRLPVERIRDGYYTDAYFNFTRQLLEARPATARA